jgi:UDPglucose 6-dehydrogenase
MEISIIGGGYVGTVTGICLAELGNNVTIVDIDIEKIDKINNGIPPIYEPGLQEILEKNSEKIHATKKLHSAVMNTDISFICVGTPSGNDGSIDLKYIESAAADIGKALRKKERFHVIIVKSTVIPGTCDTVVVPCIARNSGKVRDIGFAVCSNPEFLREGRAVYDFHHPDRIIIGSENIECLKILRQLYSGFDCPFIECSIKTAEMIKYVSNAFLALKISYANEIGNLCKVMGIDSYDVFKGVGLDNRIGPLFFNAGLGFGGSCFPKDVKALQSLAKSYKITPILLNAVLQVNSEQPGKMISLLEQHLSLDNKKIGVLGLAFKPDTDDIREAKSIEIVTSLLAKGARVIAYDPMAVSNFKKLFPGITYTNSAEELVVITDALVIVTEWPEFEKLNYKGKIVIDGRRIIKAKETAEVYEGVCW